MSLDALTELYRERERWDDLAELYLRRAESRLARAGRSVPACAGAACTGARARPSARSISCEEIVRALPRHPEAIKELEALREQPRAQGAGRRHPAAALRIARRLAAPDPAQRGPLHAGARRGRKGASCCARPPSCGRSAGDDLSRARRALEVAVKLDPDDAEVRAEYERLAERTAPGTSWPSPTKDVLTSSRTCATSATSWRCWRRCTTHARRSAPRARRLRAAVRHRRDRHRAAQQDGAAGHAAQRLAALVRVLTAKADLVLDDEERASVWRRVGEAKRDMLDDARGAIAGYEHALELDPESAFTVDCLIELYEAKGDAARLVELYQRRVELTRGRRRPQVHAPGQRRAVATRRSCPTAQGDRDARAGAAGATGDSGVLGSLNRLYRAEAMWARAAGQPQARGEHRRDDGQSARSARRSATSSPTSWRASKRRSTSTVWRSRRRRRRRGDRGGARDWQRHEELRGTRGRDPGAGARAGWAAAELCDVLELRLTVETEPTERVQTLRTIARVLETNLGKQAGRRVGVAARDQRASGRSGAAHRARAAVTRHLGLCPLRRRLVRSRRLHLRSGGSRSALRAARAHLRGGAEGRSARRDRLQAGGRAGRRPAGAAGRARSAVHAARRARGGGRNLGASSLRRSSDERQADLYFRLALLQIQRFQEPARGLGSLRMALERVAGHEAAVAELEKLVENEELFEEVAEMLESVYRSRGLTDRLAKLYEKRVGFADSRGRAHRHASQPGARARRGARSRGRAARDRAGPGRGSRGQRAARRDRAPGSDHGRVGQACQALASAIAVKSNLTPESGVELSMRLAGWYRDKALDNAAAESALKARSSSTHRATKSCWPSSSCSARRARAGSVRHAAAPRQAAGRRVASRGAVPAGQGAGRGHGRRGAPPRRCCASCSLRTTPTCGRLSELCKLREAAAGLVGCAQIEDAGLKMAARQTGTTGGQLS